MKLTTIRIDVGETLTTEFGTAIPLQPDGTLGLGNTGFQGILSTLTLRFSGVTANTRAVTARLTEDSDGDLITMPDASCGFSLGVTTASKATSVYKYEVQFSDEYPINLFVKTDNSSVTLDEVILQYRSNK